MKSTLKHRALPLIMIGLMLAGCNSPEEKEAGYIRRGNAFFDQGEFEKARVEYKNAARIKPADAEVSYRIGLVDEAEENYAAAFTGFTHAEQQNAHFHRALLKLAQYYLAGEIYDESKKRVDAVLADSPDEPEAHALLAALALRRKDFETTEKEARFALGKDPASVIAFLVLTGLYTAQDNNARAVATAEEGIARNPQSLPLLLVKLRLYEHSDDIAKIAETWQAVFRLKPAEPQFRLGLANAYLNAGKIDDAEATLRAGVAAMPGNENMKHQLAMFLGDHRGIDVAEKEIRGTMQADPKNDGLYFWLTDLYIAHGATGRAVTLLEQIVARGQFDRLGLNARDSLARIHFAKGNRELAGKLVAAVLEKDPDNREALFIRASLALDRGFYRDAATDLRSIIRDNPKAGDALQLLGEALLFQGHLDLAIETLNQVTDMDSSNIPARVRLAQMYNLNGNPKRALQLLASVNKADPSYAVGWENTARIAIGSKDWGTAEAAIRALNTLDGQHMTATFLEGQALAKSGRNEDAVIKFTQVVNDDPASPLAEHALSALVVAYRDLGRMETATRYIETLKTGSPYVATVLGECYGELGKFAESAAALDRAIAGHPGFQEPYLDRANLYLKDHAPDQAIDMLKQGIAAAPSDLRASIMEAQTLGALGRYQEAIPVYDELLARNPELDAAANNLAATIADYEYADPAALEKARQAAERFINSPNPLFLDTLAWVYYRQGNMPQAQMVAERAQAAGGEVPPQVHYHYGAIFLKAGKTKEAKSELQHAAAEGPDYPGRDEAKKLLEKQ